ncbi:MAG: arginine--tRNA ligase [Coriobacteriales bacterium]|jgi:arginyl-tRNA synthetase|nr:arginine--tRNA ligase [Coriobacteriales bacterium]
MRHSIEDLITQAIRSATDTGALPPSIGAVPDVAVERPRDGAHGDWATTVALRLSKQLGRPPREIAAAIAACVPLGRLVAAVEVAGPGFINLRLTEAALQDTIRKARAEGARFGSCDAGGGETVNVEFVSANPTGPMHVGHGRWAALGNALCNVLAHAGWRVTREFYINDAGSQMELFGHSIALRYRELCGEHIEMPENSYGGAYVTDIAARVLQSDGRRWLEVEGEKRDAHFRETGYRLMLEQMHSVCDALGTRFDVWFSERSLYEATEGESPVSRALAALKDRGCLYEKDGATWFRTTDHGDDKDRVLVKADGSFTYFMPDIAYHISKFERGSSYLVNIWGADHHGYIPRMQAACAALGQGGRLTVVLGQLVNLFRAGEAVRMSKRAGELVTFEELVEEVGPDATKYLMLARSSDQPIDFDIEAAKKQDASNPVYYVQYAHARICSLLRKAAEEGISPGEIDAADLALLVDASELELARVFSRLAEVVEGCARDYAPFRLTHYAEELATAFHRFYTECHIVGPDRALSAARLYLADAARSVLATTLGLLGVSAPERM